MKTIHLAAPALSMLLACSAGSHGGSSGPSTGAMDGDSGLAPTIGDDGGLGGDAGIGAAQGSDGDTDAGIGLGVSTDGATCDGGAPGDPDPLDDQGLDTNCDGADGVVGVDVYVDPQAGQDTNPGTPQSPMATLTAALKLAASRMGNVVVDTGTLQDGDLSAPGTWAIHGGYSAAFVGAPDRSLTTLAPTSSGVLLEQASSARLAHVTVMPQPPQTGMAPSTCAVRSSVAQLELLDVDLHAPPAGSGTTGATGTVGASGADGTTCSGVAKPATSVGRSAGTDAVSPDGVTQPGQLGSNPTRASQARSGYAGSDGDDAQGTISLVNGLVVGDVGTSGQGDGSPGYGGATGADGTYKPQSGYATQFLGGAGGNGGCPSGGGQPGTSGGSSVGVLVLAGQLSVVNSSIEAGLGGTGGDGGGGGAGGPGAPGGPPAASYDQPPFTISIPATCTLGSDPLGFNCAAYGGQGGNGGAGGRGGGGGGGWSIGILLASGATATVDAVTTLTLSKGGLGGVGNGGTRAPSGQAHSKYTLP